MGCMGETMAGKTGADAVFIALKNICRVVVRYNVKLNALIDAAVAASIITSPEGTTAKAFVGAAVATCAIFEKLAGYNSL